MHGDVKKRNKNIKAKEMPKVPPGALRTDLWVSL